MLQDAIEIHVFRLPVGDTTCGWHYLSRGFQVSNDNKEGPLKCELLSCYPLVFRHQDKGVIKIKDNVRVYICVCVWGGGGGV